LAHEGGKVVSPTHRLHFNPPPPGRLSQPWGHVAGRIVSMKNSNETIGIEPTTFWLVDLES